MELVQFQAPFFVGFYRDCPRVIRSTSSTDWAKEEYVELVQFQAPFSVGFNWDCSRVIRSTSSADWALENNTKGNLFSFPLKSVGYELSSRVVSNQVFSPLQRLTSVFGMGTGGPTAFITPTNRFLGLVHLRGLEPRTHWLRVSCSTSWAKGASRRVPSEQTFVCP